MRACHRARCTQGRALRVALKRVSLDSLCARRPRHPGGRGGRKPAARSNKRNGRMKGGDHARLSPHSRQGLRERKEAMEQRSSRRLRELVTPIAPIEACLLIRSNARSYPMMARSRSAPPKGRIHWCETRTLLPHRSLLQRTAGPYIGVKGCPPHPAVAASNPFRSTPNSRHDSVGPEHLRLVPIPDLLPRFYWRT